MANKKAISTEVLMYLLGVIIFAFVLVIGYRMVFQFKEKSDDILLIKFEKDIQSMTDSVSFGTTKIREFEVPPGYKEFWLIDSKNVDDATGTRKFACTFVPPVIELDSPAVMQNNAFLIGPQKFQAFKIERINIADGCLKADVNSDRITIGLRKG